MVGIVCLQLAPESDFSHFNATLNTTVVDTALMNDVRLGISGTLACLTALIQVFEIASYFKKQIVRDFYDAMSTFKLLHVCRLAWGSCSLGSWPSICQSSSSEVSWLLQACRSLFQSWSTSLASTCHLTVAHWQSSMYVSIDSLQVFFCGESFCNDTAWIPFRRHSRKLFVAFLMPTLPRWFLPWSALQFW